MNSNEIYQKHIQEIHPYKYVFRFPPEPNGFLHLGHAKSIRANFYSAKILNGICYLRYDDTNPETENQFFINEIKQSVLWFGFEPYKITYASDYFPQLYQYALQLIKNGKAYVCELPQEKMRQYRQEKKPSPYQDRSVEESLKLFEEMKQGLQPNLTLRAKIDYQNSNPTLRDPVIYRYKKGNHPKTKDEWKIYPTYDFAHCICDSLENITHSLCSLEFEIRRELYYWFLDQLGLYKPIVYEFSRLNISHNILSKRKLISLIQNKHVNGWDDPRLFTLRGLQRRGYSPEIINAFLDEINVSRSGNENITNVQLLEAVARQILYPKAQKVMAVMEPMEILIENYGEFFKGEQTQKSLIVDKNDVRDTQPNHSEVEFYGIFPNATLSLKYLGVIQINEVNNNGIKCKLLSTQEKDRRMQKAQIHWIDPKESRQCEIRVFNNLFNVENPSQYDNFQEYINQKSIEVYKQCQLNRNTLEKVKVGDVYQFERLGFFVVDSDSDLEKRNIVFNRIVGLKERIDRQNIK